MATKLELQQLALTRLEEVKALSEKGLYDGAFYLAGYVVELALKARICTHLEVDNYLDSGEISRSFKTHNLKNLLILSGLQGKFSREISKNFELLKNWSLILDWTAEHRYKLLSSSSRKELQGIINALDNKNNGVLTWIKKHW